MNAKEYLESKGVFGLDTKKRYNEVIGWMEGYAQEVVKNCSIPVVSGSKVHRITQIQKHLENGDIKFTRTPLFEPPKLIIGCDLAVEGTSDYSVTYYR